MVSLVNFKIVSEDILQQQRRVADSPYDERASGDMRYSVSSMQGDTRTSIVKNQSAGRTKQQRQDQRLKLQQANSKSANECHTHSAPSGDDHTKSQSSTTIMMNSEPTRKPSVGQPNQQRFGRNEPPNNDDNDRQPSQESSAINKYQNHARQVTNFTITWRNLKFSIEPKWHEKLAGSASLNRLVGRLAGGRAGPMHPTAAPATSGSACLAIGASPTQLQGASQQANSGANSSAAAAAAVTRVVLDRLDGSFKSGELTAILGPSGAGKTTLLDCLTGHRKHGLSGSIRISSDARPTDCCCFVDQNGSENLGMVPAQQADRQSSCSSCSCTCSEWRQSQSRQHSQAQAAGQAALASGDNLKVSIIPQNDHLMGHLTVYETLNYASKMKNCFDKQFNHKLNIRRVAQQLGLMSCLGNRINKLSGGQYKRVSIAQELLSSPDILILDEPTSGLDAMTCYQTVQVLKKLTDEMRDSADGLQQKQIAVILTIHQPNSDVFQQFNNVYVVAQGGKCIYEGPPGGIESVINRVGIHLPNSYYNPATMIVEIAAGKFGADAIQKLNAIQRKQYEFIYLNDEQNSTGDSAVDCPSSSSSSSDSDGDEGEQQKQQLPLNNNNNNNTIYPATICCDSLKASDKQVEINNNAAAADEQPLAGGGLINKGFVIEEEQQQQQQTTTTTNSSSQPIRSETIRVNNNIEILVVPPKPSIVSDSIANHDQQLARRAIEEPSGGYKSNQLAAVVAHEPTGDNNKRKKRRRRRVQSQKSEAVVPIGSNDTGKFNDCLPIKTTFDRIDDSHASAGRQHDSGGDGGSGGGGGREKRLKLNSLKADQRFPFWRHTYLHFHRSWLSIVRDPMLCSMQLALHIIVPVMVSLVYGTGVGKPNACPRAGPVDIMAYALEPTDTALQLQEDLRTTLENIGYIFFKLYGIIFAAMTVTVLTFPLDMHVLVKEFRNGWYGLSSYFLGRTLADIPFQLTLPLLAMSLSYYATGQPYSYMQWRFLSITAILILSSLIAQSQGLLFGAILMDKMKAAVFVAPAATTPIILFAGFLVRTQSIPRYLRPLSNLSYLRYAIEACLISRYGFNQCECDPAIFNQTVPELPPIARSMLDYWLGSFRVPSSSESSSAAAANDSLANETTTMAGSEDRPDLFTKLIDSLAKANSFGRNITSCEQVVPYPMIDYDLKDSQLVTCFAILLLMLVFTRFLTFFIVCFKVKRKV